MPGSFESLGATLENPAPGCKAGVTIAFHVGRRPQAPGDNIKQEAGNTVAYRPPLGRRPRRHDLQVLARIWGMGGSLGTLDPGEDATW